MTCPSGHHLSDEAINGHVRLMLKMRRRVVGHDEPTFAAAVGLTVDQLKAYERGRMVLTPALLWRMTRMLRCTPNDIFSGLDGDGLEDRDLN